MVEWIHFATFVVLRHLRSGTGVAPIILEGTFIAAMALQDWVEAGVAALLLFNAIVAFVQEVRGHRAMEQLRASLHITARVLRSREWVSLGARELVPGDVIRLRMGDMVPADFVLLSGGPLDIDQSALTGESLPVNKDVSARIFAGSIAAKGEGVGGADYLFAPFLRVLILYSGRLYRHEDQV
jgi:H+-transporting ATPase